MDFDPSNRGSICFPTSRRRGRCTGYCRTMSTTLTRRAFTCPGHAQRLDRLMWSRPYSKGAVACPPDRSGCCGPWTSAASRRTWSLAPAQARSMPSPLLPGPLCGAWTSSRPSGWDCADATQPAATESDQHCGVRVLQRSGDRRACRSVGQGRGQRPAGILGVAWAVSARNGADRTAGPQAAESAQVKGAKA